jgi:hypothetical protein
MSDINQKAKQNIAAILLVQLCHMTAVSEGILFCHVGVKKAQTFSSFMVIFERDSEGET